MQFLVENKSLQLNAAINFIFYFFLEQISDSRNSEFVKNKNKKTKNRKIENKWITGIVVIFGNNMASLYHNQMMNTIIIILTMDRSRFSVTQSVMLRPPPSYSGIMIRHFVLILHKLLAIISLDHIALYHCHRFRYHIL